MTFKTNIDSIKHIFEDIEKPLSDSERTQLQKKIEELGNHLNDADNANVYKELLSLKFHVTIIQMIKISIDRNEHRLVCCFFKFVSLVTEYSEEFSESMVQEDVPDLLISTTIRYGDKTLTPKCQDLSTTFDNIVYYNLHITYHVIRHFRFQQCFLLHPDINRFKQTILPRMSSKIVNTRILVTFVLTWLMEEDNEDRYIIEKHSDIVQNVSDYIKEALRTEDKYYRGYSLWELLKGIQALVFIDSIKTEIMHVDGFIPSLVTVVSLESSNPKDIETAVGILWSLTFVKKNRDILKRKYHIETVVEHLLNNDKSEIRKKTKGLLWELNKKRKVNREENNSKYDVFISYCHSESEQIAAVADVLRKRFKIWIDMDNIKGSGLSDMATGIEQSTVFLMAVSSSYKQSQCCRSEANWAFKLSKPLIPLLMTHRYSPDGWLGMMISTETYVDYSEQSDFDRVCEKIIEKISHKCIEADERFSSPHRDMTNGSEYFLNSWETTKSIKEWNGQDVGRWLAGNKLSHLSAKFVDFDGGMLLAMKNMMEKTYEKYNDHLEKKFKMSLTEILKFDSALSSLKT